MNQNCFHLSDEDLLLAADGELSKRRLVQVRAHLSACWTCRARMAEIESMIGHVVRLTRETLGPELPPIDGARARLKAQLEELVESPRPNPFQQLFAGLNPKRFIYALTLLFLLALGTRPLYRKIREYDGHGQGNFYSAALPNPILTPGATQSVPLARLCSSEHDQVVRKVPESVRKQVLGEYGLAGARSADFEIDHLVTPGLAGSDDIRNLWPEPRYRTVWNSYVKDQLEDHLHNLVCNGQINLTIAQREIANDWISAYQKYFHTNAPLLPYSISGLRVSVSKGARTTEPSPVGCAEQVPEQRQLIPCVVWWWGTCKDQKPSERALAGHIGLRQTYLQQVQKEISTVGQELASMPRFTFIVALMELKQMGLRWNHGGDWRSPTDN